MVNGVEVDVPKELANGLLGHNLATIGELGDGAPGRFVHRRDQVELLPPRPVRAAVLDPVLAGLAGDQAPGRRALGTEAATRDRAGRITLDLDDLLVLDVDELAAADRAVGTHRSDDAVGRRDAAAPAFGSG